MSKSKKNPAGDESLHHLHRRNFLKGAAVSAVSAAALAANPAAAIAQPKPRSLAPPLRHVSRCRSGHAAARRSADHGPPRLRFHGRCHQVPGLRIRRRQSRIELPRPARIAASTTAATRAPNSSPAATKNRPSPWPMATPKSKASRCWCWRTAPWACSTPPWPSTTPIATACPST